ncbi:MAG: L-threonine 3-dehydrogenase [Lachnospiraceae bacterium]|nr:L-threonine 3-dehydrogenase [Lachnospiraceae bacterium]
MKCLVKTAKGKGNLAIMERDIPTPKAGEVLVKVEYTAICGTDVHINDWEEWASSRITPPVIMGHEFCGKIVAVGEGVSESRIGELVSAESHFACHKCPLCLDEKENLCINTRGIGVHFDGCFAEYVAFAAENAFVCNPKISPKNNAMLEPLGVAVHAATKVEISGNIVVVLGCGPIGLMATSVVKMMGARKVICVEPNAYRAETAAKMGADIILNPMEGDIVEMVRKESDGIGPDVVLEFSGNVGAIQSATKYIRSGGGMVIGGLPSREVPVDFSSVFYRGVTMYGISGREMYHTWKIMAGLLEAGLDVSECVSHVMPLEDYEKAFELLAQGKALKILFKF